MPSDGSPFDLTPPPPERARSGSHRVGPDPRSLALPAPPPAPGCEPVRPGAGAWAAFAALLGLAFAPAWGSSSRADLLGAALCCALVFAYRLRRPGVGARATLLTVSAGVGAAAAAFWLCLQSDPSAAPQRFEALLFGALAIGALAASLFLGVSLRPPELLWSLAMLAGCGAAAAAAGAAISGAESALGGAGQAVTRGASALLSRAGLLRWLGVAVAYAAWKVLSAGAVDQKSWVRRGEDAARASFNK